MTWVLLGSFLIIYFTWGMYLAAMNLIRVKDKLTLPAKIFAYPLVGIGMVLDAFVNVTIGTVLFLELPKRVLLTARLQDYIDTITDEKPDTKLEDYRQCLAVWICTHLLDPFDSRGFHCREKK